MDHVGGCVSLSDWAQWNHDAWRADREKATGEGPALALASLTRNSQCRRRQGSHTPWPENGGLDESNRHRGWLAGAGTRICRALV